ncbi:endonuclease [Oceanihabitans sp. 2_MG-2023]|uniref:endonuclease/exonuclease/phosphatase family protein n=1 Tax=Oceanihabitans sp. 2_MG-2023 TaxID=3062661 RepID=UPI0026E45ABA|nr:endonuclease [Oceanihabitans sp. 2_MG-2023]MDO6595629.1 endonuclease [Oceanihabitans sp. 2_MG-2023]
MIDYSDIPEDVNVHTIAFYNTENLFDIFDDEKKHDNDFLPRADKRWTAKRYKNKLRKLGYTISNIGRKENGKHPAIIGLAEVENAKVLQDLITSKHLENCNYNYVHYNSKDERGIDVALLYDATVFTVETSEKFALELYNDAGLPDYTRDILLVSGELAGNKIHVIVNHWSSRREGERETEHKRMAGSNKVGEIISNLKLNDPDAKILIIGDFNDDPSSTSIKRLVSGFDLFNPMGNLRSFTRGTSKHKRQWFLFDQIFVTKNFLETSEKSLHLEKINIFDADFLKVANGKYKGSPFRTYVGKRYQGGYSDHFPVYAVLRNRD